jgi:hypothetical protein
VLRRLGFDELVSSHLPEPDPRQTIEAVRALGVLVRNLCVGRQPLYGIAAWAGGMAPGLLGLSGGQAGSLNDDKVGRALDALFLADRASLLVELSLRVIRRYRIDVSELHNDSTSITLYGAYRGATGQPQAGVRPPVPERGFSKDCVARCASSHLVVVNSPAWGRCTWIRSPCRRPRRTCTAASSPRWTRCNTV